MWTLAEWLVAIEDFIAFRTYFHLSAMTASKCTLSVFGDLVTVLTRAFW
jgi:hypothetical protein